MFPQIKKAKFIFGSNIILRNVDEDDAEFIFKLRMDPIKNKFLSATSGKVEDQINWIRGYKQKNDQAYFIITNESEDRLGCIRMYDPIDKSFCWGSWLLKSGLSPLVSLESAVLIYAYAKHLGFEEAKIDVRQDNRSVWSFHEKFSSAKLVNETDSDRFYLVSKESIDYLLKKYSSMITSPLRIVQT